MDNTLEVRKKNYRLRGFNEFTGADWRRLTLNMERVVSIPEEFVAMARSTVAVVAPAAIKDMKKWTDVEILYACAVAINAIRDTAGEGAKIMRRYTVAGEIVSARFTEMAKSFPSG